MKKDADASRHHLRAGQVTLTGGLAPRDLPPTADLLKRLPRTAAWPAMPPLAAMAGTTPPELRRAV